MDILSAFSDPAIFGNTFRGPSWSNWRAVLAGLYGLRMTRAQGKVFSELTGRTELPRAPATEAHIVAGRRSGKSTVAGGLAVYTAISRDFRPYLPPGGFATIFIVSPDRTQSRIVHRVVRGLIEQSPMLRPLVSRDTESLIELSNGVAIEVGTASARTLRGYSCPLVILDELAFFDVAADAADTDEAIIQALLPSLATIPGSMILGISSPYARRGTLWDRYDRYWGKNDAPCLVYRAPTRLLNPTLPQSIVDAALEKDPAAAQAEWLAEFRSDRDSFVSREIVASCVDKGLQHRPPEAGITYVGFVDPAGGAGADSFALAIAHLGKDGVAVLDCVVSRRPPFSAESVIAEMSAWLTKYHVLNVRGDHFSGAIVGDMFRKCGINFTPHPQPKRELYRNLLPMLTSGKVALLDLPTLHDQLISLERQVSRGGTETISHGIGGHDDIANAAAGALTIAADKGKFNAALLYAAPVLIGGAGPVNPGVDPTADTGERRITLTPMPRTSDESPAENVWPGVWP